MFNKKFLLIILTIIFIINLGLVFAEDADDLNQTVNGLDMPTADDGNINLDEVTLDSEEANLSSSDDDVNLTYDDAKLSSSDGEILKDSVISEDIPLVERGTVSGGVDLIATHPWAPSNPNGNYGGITYSIPSQATDIKFAYVYVNVYAGSSQPTYDLIVNTTITTGNGVRSYSEYLWYPTGVIDGTRFVVNDHIDKVYSDYMIFYNITDLVQGLNGTQVAVDVLSLPGNRSFDGRIKLVSLVIAYDDGDDDEVYYWLNVGQAWTNAKTGVTFDVGEIEATVDCKATLTNIGLSSTDAFYQLNGMDLICQEDYGDAYIDGSYYQYHEWDLTDIFESEMYFECTASSAGWASFKEAMSLFVIDNNYYSRNSTGADELSFKTEYSSGVNPIILVYAGTNNTITASVKVNNPGNYNLKLLVDGVEVDGINVILQKQVRKDVYLTDPTIRPIDKNTAYNQNYDKTNYTLLLYYDGELVNSFSAQIPVLYNGFLSKDFAYESGYDIPFSYNASITGDIVVDVKDNNTYLNRKDLNRTDVWDVELPSGSSLVKALIYIPYNYYIPNYLNNITEDENLIEINFNGVKISPCGYYRDQSNILLAFTTEYPYAVYGYGVFIYDVTGYLRDGENTLFINKFDEYPALDPSALIYMYNMTGSDAIKYVYIDNTADILENSYNDAGRPVELNTQFNVSSELVESAELYVFAATDDSGDDAYIIFNGAATRWSINGRETSYKKLNVKNTVKDINNVTFGAYPNVVGYRFFALQQIMVVTKKVKTAVSSISTEYGNVVFAGTSNKVLVEITNTRIGNFTVNLYADGVFVGSRNVSLDGKSASISLIDSNIRPVDENAVYGATNNRVNYTAEIIFNGERINSYSIYAPVLYDGYLGKDLSYPSKAFDTFFEGTITGDIVIDVKNYTSYLDNYGVSRTDTWSVNLASNSNFVKSYIYVPYNYFNPYEGLNESLSMFSTKFNGVDIAPVLLYRDQINFGNEADYGYGVLVYDVSQLIKTGSNSFVLNKKSNIPFVYPSALIYMYNTTGSKTIKNVYISNEADLLSAIDFNELDREVKVDSVFNVNSTGKLDAKLYIFAAGAQKGEGNVVFNNQLNEDVWNGNSNSTDLYVLDITNSVNDANSVSFVSTGSYLLALQQIMVITKNAPDDGSDVPIKTTVTQKALSTTYDSGKAFTVKVLDADKKPVSALKLTVKIYTGSKYITKTLKTNANGIATFTGASTLSVGTHKVVITSSDAKYSVSKITSSIKVSKAGTVVTAKKLTVKYKKSKYFTVTVKNKATKKPVKSIVVKIKVFTGKKAKIYNIKTNSKGIAKFNTKQLQIGTHNVVIYSGNSKYVINQKSAIVVKK